MGVHRTINHPGGPASKGHGGPMFKRKCYDKLLEWKRLSHGTSALLIEGARRVGKTTLVQEFAKNEYADSLYIDFSRAGNDTLELFRTCGEVRKLPSSHSRVVVGHTPEPARRQGGGPD